LKVRIITKGPAAAYYRSVELQKFMHGILRRCPLFELVGAPVSARQIEHALGFPERDELLVSGDYESATDNLDPRLIDFTWDLICNEATYRGGPLARTPYYLLGKSLLTGHTLIYNGKRRDEILEVDQSWGQLMGSPMSFPILNLINVAAAFAGIGWDLRFRKPSEWLNAPIRVNGDDVVLKIPRDRYPVWKEIVTSCGLKPSLGKNYTAKDFVIINSTLFRIHDRQYWEENFVRQSLIDGAIVKGMDAGVRRDFYWTDLGSLSHKILDGLPACQQARIFKLWRYRQEDLFKEVPTGCNYYISRELGGAGISYAGQPLSEMDLKKAAWASSLSPVDRLSRVVATPSKARGSLFDLVRDTRMGLERQGRCDVVDLLNGDTPTESPGSLGALLRGESFLADVKEGEEGNRMRKDHSILASRLAISWRRSYEESVSWPGEPMSIDLAVNYNSGKKLSVTVPKAPRARDCGREIDDYFTCLRKVKRWDLAD
jgi:hypothetical protein